MWHTVRIVLEHLALGILRAKKFGDSEFLTSFSLLFQSVVTGVVWLHSGFFREKGKTPELEQLLEDEYNRSYSKTEDPLRPSSKCRWYGAPQPTAGQ